jgi:uracil-DNA glycosylase
MGASEASDFEVLCSEVRACRVCRDTPLRLPLPHEPRPVFIASRTATICVAGQAPGTRVHASGTPFTDPSGDRLRGWMGIGPEIFYDSARISVIPMGFCFPGLSDKGADLPPRAECAPRWHDRLYAAMPQLRLVLAVGSYAQRYHLGDDYRGSLSATVEDWPEVLEASQRRGRAVIPLPHPSWRNNAWLKLRPWFEAELLPELRKLVRAELRRTAHIADPD